MTGLQIADHRRIVFFTGAGLSAECGLPTYRGAGGLWASYKWEEYACQRAFDRDPARVWVFHEERRRVMAAAQPGLAHRIMARVQASLPGTCIVTQNIDGLHQRAGSADVIELHGSVWRLRCGCRGPARTETRIPLPSTRCETCGAWLRPDIVWFEDPLSVDAIRRAGAAMRSCDLLLSVGTSGVVYPAAALPQLAAGAGATCVEINPEATAVSQEYDVHIRSGAGEALQSLWPEFA